MKKASFLITLCLLSFLGMQAQGIDFIHEDLEQAKKESRQTGKPIFIDAYTTWCGPCKRLSKYVFPEAEAGELFNAQYINLKLDMEKGEGPGFARRHGVASYPTLLIIDAEENIIHTAVGALPLPDFIEFGKKGMQLAVPIHDFQSAYEEGDRSYETIYHYVDALNKTGQSSIRIVNEYIRSQDDMSRPENIKFLAAAISEVDSKAYTLLKNNIARAESLVDPDVLESSRLRACRNTAAKAIAYESPELLDRALEEVKNLDPDLAAEGTDWVINYYREIPDPTGYTELLGRKDWTDADRIKLAQLSLKTYARWESSIKAALDMMEKVRDYQGHETLYYPTMIRLYSLTGKKKSARKLLDAALAYAEEKGLDWSALTSQIDSGR